MCEFFQPQSLICVQTFPNGREQDDLGEEDANDAADEDDVAAFDADMRQYAEQVHTILHNMHAAAFSHNSWLPTDKVHA